MSTMPQTPVGPIRDERSGAEQRASLWAGVLAAVPLAVAFAGFGVAFGSLARTAGIGPVAAVVLSATAFAGSAQFAAVSVLGAGGSVAAAVAAAVLLNARYGPIGLSVAPVLGGPWWRRLVVGQLVVDESWAIANRGNGSFDRARLIGAGAVLYLAWVTSTAVGALGASVLADPRALGLDAAFPALFLALLWPQLRERRAAAVAALGAGIALVTLSFAPPGVPIVAAAAACLLGVRR
jgi:branched chain amino acid efflux pump